MQQLKKVINLLTHELFLAYIIGSIFLIETLNFHRFFPSIRNLNLGIQILFGLTLGMLLILANRKFVIQRLGVGILGWGFFLVVILIQPIVNNILYPDSLLLTVAPLVFLMLLTLIIYQIEDKTKFISVLAKFILLAALLQFLTILAHLFQLQSLYGTLIYPIDYNGRAVGNLGQPNQSAFLLALGIASTLYLLQDRIDRLSKQAFLAYLIIACLSIGIAITASRGGIILAVVAIVVYLWLNVEPIKRKVAASVIFMGILLVSLYLGSLALKLGTGDNRSVVARVADKGISIRGYQIEQSWEVIKENPIFGIGWNQFITSVLPYKNQIPWFSMADHTHFLPSQIAAELGILGLLVLIPLSWILFKRLFNNKSRHDSYVLTILAIFIAYSLSEYPLWYLNFLMLFVVFLALSDETWVKTSLPDAMLKRVFAILLMFSLPIIAFYGVSYSKYSTVYGITTYANLSKTQELELVNQLPKVFGFLDYKEYITFNVLPVNNEQLDEKIALGNRVIQLHPEPDLMTRQGLFYGLQGDKEAALELFKATCMFEDGRFCQQAAIKLENANQQLPKYYSQIYHSFIIWKTQNHK